jgi:ubiquinone/menaquinone biosynthesis C-methylase UbiE
MTGMGECWRGIVRRISPRGRLVAVDISEKMVEAARLRRERRFPADPITILRQDLLNSGLADQSAQHVVVAFGVKTFSEQQREAFARELLRILKPGGTFSLVEVSVPRQPLLRALYLFYLKRVIPVLGWLFLGNPDNYRMLGVYTERYGDSRQLCAALERAGFEVAYHDLFFGCASGVSGTKPGWSSTFNVQRSTFEVTISAFSFPLSARRTHGTCRVRG